MLDINYDDKFDVLYLNIANSSQSYSAEVVNGLNTFRDLEDDSITGFILFGFMQKLKAQCLPTITDPVPINFEKEIIPYISL